MLLIFESRERGKERDRGVLGTLQEEGEGARQSSWNSG
jgi:hypothetical protein